MSRRALRRLLLSLPLLLLLPWASRPSAARLQNLRAQAGWLGGLRALLQDCPVKSARLGPELTPSQGFVRALCECARRRAWLAIDQILEEDVVPVLHGLQLVRYRASGPLPPLRDEKEEDWREKVNKRLSRLLSTHLLKIDLNQLQHFGATSNVTGRFIDEAGQARGRRRRKRQMQMMPIVMMGVLLMGSVLIPMGFQFLAVLGGKALILAKMALMLSSIQGLKKIATSGVNYGLYHTSVPEAWHERSSYIEVPYDGPQPPPPPPPPPHGSHPYLGHFAAGHSAVHPT